MKRHCLFCDIDLLQDSLKNPSGGAVSRTGRKRHQTVRCGHGDITAVDLAAGERIIDELLEIFLREPGGIRVSCYSDNGSGDDPVLEYKVRREHPEIRILVQRLLLRKQPQLSEHGPVLHIVPVDHRILIGEIG